MVVHPTKNRIYRYWSIPICQGLSDVAWHRGTLPSLSRPTLNQPSAWKNRTYCSRKRFNGGSKLQRSVHTAHMQNTSKYRNRRKRFRICCSQSDSQCPKTSSDQIISVVDMGKFLQHLRFQIPLETQTSMLGQPRTWRKEFAADQVHRPVTRCRSRRDQGRVAGTMLNKCKKNVNITISNIKIT